MKAIILTLAVVGRFCEWPPLFWSNSNSHAFVHGFAVQLPALPVQNLIIRDSKLRTKKDDTGEAEGYSPSTAAVLLLPTNPSDPLVKMCERIIALSDPTVNVSSISCTDLASGNGDDNLFIEKCQQTSLVLALGIQSPMDLRTVATLFRKRRTYHQDTSNDRVPMAQFSILGGKPFAPLVDQWDEANPTDAPSWQWWRRDAAQEDRQLMLDMQTLFNTQSDDINQAEENIAQAMDLFFGAKAT